MMPKVSVIMSVFEDQLYVGEAIESILNQKLTDFEFLIIDDCGKDDTAQIVDRYAKDDARIRLLRNQVNKGLTWSLNKGFTHATGQYIARMDADDVSHPDRLFQQVAFMDNHPEVGISGTFHQYSNETDVRKGPCTHDEIIARLLFSNVFCHSSVMFRTRIIEDNNLRYDTSFVYSQDYELWVRAMTLTKLANIPINLLNYRVHDKQISVGKRSLQRQFLQKIWLRYFMAFEIKLGIGQQETHERLINRYPIGVISFLRLNIAYRTLLKKNLKKSLVESRRLKLEIRKSLVSYLDTTVLGQPKKMLFWHFIKII